jgi:hypothetical protein
VGSIEEFAGVIGMEFARERLTIKATKSVESCMMVLPGISFLMFRSRNQGTMKQG